MFKSILFLTIILFISCQEKSVNVDEINPLYIEITHLIKESKNNSISDSLRNNCLNEAKIKLQKLKNDSLKTRTLVKMAYANLVLGNWEEYKDVSFYILNRSLRRKDTLNIAKAQSYLGYYYQFNSGPDSAYYFYNRALKSYSFGENNIESGKMLLSMATIQENVKDFTGSEINTIRAISKLSNSKQYRSLYLAYNNLGVVYNKLGNFDLAIESNRKAIEYLDVHIGNKYLKAMSLNNIGWVYIEKENYKKSIEILNEALKTENLHENRPQTFAIIIDNLAYSKFKLGDEAELPELFYQSLKIRDSLHIYDGIAESNLHLSEYFLSKKDTIKAFKFAENAKINAQKVDYNDGLLESYFLLSKLEPGEKGKVYLNKYIKLSDSLQQKEREIREKFTRIAYETEEIEKENEVITKKNWWLTIALIVGGAFFMMIYFYIQQRAKNKELIFNQKQEEANTEIYNLMISEKLKFQEGSLKERVRISEELHDNIVNKLFGTRLALSLINSGIPEDEISEWEGHIESLRELEEEIRTISHDLKVEVFNIGNTFEKMVEELVEKRSKLSNFELELVFDNVTDWENISNKIKIHCYRTLQETLHNILKYADATKVSIRFYEINEMLYVEIIDNGNGFDPKNKTKGIGLKNIESRIKKLNGEVKFISSPGSGTKIDMTIPLNS